MKLYITPVLILIVTLCCCTSNEKIFYVSSSGNDNNPGTKARPFSSFFRSKEAAARILNGTIKNKEIIVYFRGGTYFFDQSVVISGEEFSKSNNKVIFSAYKNEKPVFSAGKILTSWRRVSDEVPFLPEKAIGKVWETDIPPTRSSCPIARFLSSDSGLLVNAVSEGLFTDENDSIQKLRYDLNGEYNKYSEGYNSLIFPDNSLRDWINLNDIEIITRPHYAWVVNILPLKGIDLKKKTAYTTIPGTYFICRVASEPFISNLWIQNAIDYLDEPGEWVINSAERKIYYWPEEEKPSKVYYPLMKELIRLEGNLQKKNILKNIEFSGITFTNGDRDTWDKNDVGLQHDWALYDKADALLRFKDTEGCSVDNCTFTNSGGGGVRFDFHSQNNNVINCKFTFLGGTAILFAGYGPGNKDVNRNNKIINNEIHDCGKVYLHSPAIFIWQSGGNTIAHNLIYNTPYSGIVISGPRPQFFNKGAGYKRELTGTFHFDEIKNLDDITWDKLFPYLYAKDNIIEYNELHNIVQKLDDGNAIYLSGTGYNNIVRKNYIHDNTSKGRHGAIRGDDYAKDLTIAENIIYRFARYGIVTRYTNNIINNYIIDYIPTEKVNGERHAMISFLYIIAYGPLLGSNIKKNIFYQSAGISEPFLSFDFTYPELQKLSEFPKLSDCDIDSNIYFAAGVYHDCLNQLEKHRNLGVDINSIVADPIFIGLGNAGFTLKNNSPAGKLGIKQIDFENIGLKKHLIK